VCLSLTYGSTKKIMQAACDRTGAVLRIVNIPLPVLTPETVIALFKEAISTRTKLVVLDQITSNTAMILPIADMAIMSKEVGANVVIDAAHALFSQDCSIYGDNQKVYFSSIYSALNHTQSNLDKATRASNASAVESTPRTTPTLGESNNRTKNMVSISSFADVWITNAHKWMCSPKGCAFMWVSPRMAHALRPSIISHGYVPHAGNYLSDYNQVSEDHHCNFQRMQYCTSLVAFDVIHMDYMRIMDLFPTLFSALLQDQSKRYIAPGKLLSAYSWDGCRDYSALLTMPTAISLWSSLAHKVKKSANEKNRQDKNAVTLRERQEQESSSSDLEVMRSYNRSLLAEASQLLSEEWGVSEDEYPVPRDMRENCPMALVSVTVSYCEDC
jgi:Aminotransferase class-V